MLEAWRRAAKHAMDVEEAWLRLEAVTQPGRMDESVEAVERYEADGLDRLAAINRVADDVARYGHP